MVRWWRSIGSLLVLAMGGGGCAEVMPHPAVPESTLLYYPLAAAAYQDSNDKLINSFAYIVSTNFDQRFASGWLSRLDLNNLPATWSAANVQQLAGNTLQLERQVKIPDLGGQLQLSSDQQHGYISHRGSGLITLLGVDSNGVFSCGNRQQHEDTQALLQSTDCDGNHLFDLKGQLNQVTNPAALGEQSDPFALALLPKVAQQEQLIVGFLGSNQLSQVGIDWQTTPPKTTLFPPVKLMLPNIRSLIPSLTQPTQLFVTSDNMLDRSLQNMLLSVDLTLLAAEQPAITLIDGAVNLGVQRLAKVLPLDSNTLVVSSRHPDTILLMVQQALQWQLRTAVALPDSHPADMIAITQKSGQQFVLVAGLATDTIYVLQRQGPHLQLVHQIKLASGQGPSRLLHLAAPPANPNLDCVLVTTFFDHGFSLLDTSIDSLQQLREVAHYSSVDPTVQVTVAPR